MKAFITPGLPVPVRRARRPAAVSMSSTVPPGGGTGDTGNGGINPDAHDDPSAASQVAAARAALERAMVASALQATQDGTGECDCIWCKGSGKYRCSWCGGKGVKEFLSSEQMLEDVEALKRGDPIPQREPTTAKCSACNGSCKLRCMYCKGFGKGIYGFSIAMR